MKNKTIPLFAQGYFSVPIPQSLIDEIEVLDRLWGQFCKQSLALKQAHIFDETGGYEYKPPGLTFDHKENFHLTLKYQLHGSASTTDIAFVLYGQKVIRNLLETVRNVAMKTSEATGFDITELVCTSIENWVMRFLHYFPRAKSSNGLLAVSHADKGMLTLHLAENEKGFEVLWNDKWRSVPGKHGYVHGYAGLCGQYYTQCRIPALCHRVTETRRSRTYGRTSIVIFIDAGDVRYDKAKNGSSQTMFPNGENYRIAPIEFKRLFVPMNEAIL